MAWLFDCSTDWSYSTCLKKVGSRGFRMIRMNVYIGNLMDDLKKK